MNDTKFIKITFCVLKCCRQLFASLMAQLPPLQVQGRGACLRRLSRECASFMAWVSVNFLSFRCQLSSLPGASEE